jgi:ribosome-associated protein
MTDAALVVSNSLRIPRSELSYHATRSGGPGGQHVNTSSTRIELWWNPAQSSAPDAAQRALLLERLGGRLDSAGWLRLVESGSRSQLRNREAVTERLAALLERALRPRKPRKATRVPTGVKRRRLEGKRQRGQVKRLRGKVSPDE